MAWLEAWGTYARSGAPYDVGMAGSPNESSLGLNLALAKSAGYGRGVQFTSLNDAGTSVKIELNLIGLSLANGRWQGTNTTGYASPGGGIFNRGWTYKWFVDLEYSTDGGRTYKVLQNNIQVAAHSTPMALAYNTDGRLSSWKNAHIVWSKTVSLPSNFTHLRFEVRGEDPAQRHKNIYTREQVIPPPPPPADIKPWAIRKTNNFRTLDRTSGYYRRRISGVFVDKSKHTKEVVGKTDQGTHRIRRSGSWVGQNKIGVE